MATRLRGEFISLKGQRYQIQINDSSYSGSVVDVNVSDNGFELVHDGKTDTLYSEIVGSSVSLTIFNDSVAVDSFKTDLLNAQDKRFSLRILKVKSASEGYADRVSDEGGTTQSLGCVDSIVDLLGGAQDFDQLDSELFWTGYIVQDLIEEADESKPRAMTIKAADGISLLSTLDYNFGLATSFQKDFVDVITEILTDAGVADLFESTDTMLTTAVNTFANEHVYSATSDPLANTKTDLKTFSNWTMEASRTYTKGLQVIREIAIIFGARFYFSDGSFRFEQIWQRDNTTFREFYYDKLGAATSNAEVSLDVTIDQVTKYRSGGVFRYLPAAKKTALIQQKLSAANLLGVSGTVTFPADEIDVGILPSANNGRVLLTMLSRFQTYISTPTSGTATPVFAVTLRLEPSDGTADQYWTNSLVSGVTSFGAGSWGTTSGTFKWAASAVTRSQNTTTQTSYSMATGSLPKDGELYIDITILGFYDSSGSSTSFFIGGNSYSWAVDLQTARFENDNDPASVVESTHYANNSSTTIGSEIEVPIGETRLGDGVGAMGSLYVYNGTTWVPSTGWRLNNSGSFIDIAGVVCREVLGLQANVVNRYEGVMINSDATFRNRFVFDSVNWVALRSTLKANLDELSVEVFKVSKDLTNITVSEPIDTGDDPVFAISDFVGQYVNVASGSVAGMPIDKDNERIGYFGQTSTGGEVNGTLDVTGEHTVDGFLIANGGQGVSTTAVAMTAGSSSTIATGDYLILASYSGSDGTYTFNLPAHGELSGRIIKFNFTGVTSGRNVTINADGSDTIDGSGSISVTADGILEVVAAEDEWISFP